MYIDWTKHLDTDKEKEAFRKQISSAKPVLDRLIDLLAERELILDRTETNPESFNNPNWAYLQAYKNGYRAALGAMYKLVNLDQQKVPQ